MMVELQETLNRPVDLVREGTIYPRLIQYVEADKIQIYERTA